MLPLIQDQKKIEQKMKKDYPPLKKAGKLQWSFKVRCKFISLLCFAWICCFVYRNTWQYVQAEIHQISASDVCRDKTRPKAWYEPEDLTILPEANALDPSLGEKVQTWFQNLRK
jgi:hypothetical protein